jgi:hypothetical protein
VKTVKIERVEGNNRKRVFEVHADGRVWEFPYAIAEVSPTPEDPLETVFVDSEMANEAFTYYLKSGREGCHHIDNVLWFNNEPEYMNDLMLYNVTVMAQDRMKVAGLGHRTLARRLRTSPTQIYRLLDQTNYTKSFAQMFALLRVLGCDVEVVVTPMKRMVGKT